MLNNLRQLPLAYRYLFVKNKYYYLGAFFILCAALCLYFNINKGDELLWVAANRNNFLDTLMPYWTKFGEIFTYVIMTIIFFLIGKKRHSLMIALTGIIALIFVASLKGIFAHPRPKIYFEYILDLPALVSKVPNTIIQDSWVNSFPSGHSTSAFAFFTFLALDTKHKALQFLYLSWALSVVYSRLYLFQHFLQDTIAGACLGIIVASSMYALFLTKPYPLSQKKTTS